MGVKGLLPCLQSITKHASLEKYRGLTAAIDAMCWLHKGVFTGDVGALARYQLQESQNESVLDAGKTCHPMDKSMIESEDAFVKKLSFDHCAKSTSKESMGVCYSPYCPDAMIAMNKCVDYVIRHSELVRQKYGIELILVIDGGSLPSKGITNEKRRIDRFEAYQKGLDADKRGDGREARKQFSRACSVSHEMRHLLVLQCKLRSIAFVVAPYEADAQLAKLAHHGIADVVISEDSDLLAYACPRVMFKVDFKTGKGDEIQVMRDLASNTSISFRNWNHDMFVYMCILAGCDYCEGIPGIGIKSANKYVRIHRNPNKIFRALRAAGKMPIGFEEAFWVAYKTFRHQRVYCPHKKVIEFLFPMQQNGDNDQKWDYLGPWIESELGIGIAEGKIHPTKMISWDQIELLKKRSQSASLSGGTSHFHSHKTREGAQRRSIDGAKPSPKAENDVFAFFKPKKAIENVEDEDKFERPPLQEIKLEENLCHPHRIKPLPSKPHDYASNLVATSFQTLSNNSSSRRPVHKRKGVTKAIQKLKNRLSLKKVLEKENTKKIERSGLRRVQEPRSKIRRPNIDDAPSSITTASASQCGNSCDTTHLTELNDRLSFVHGNISNSNQYGFHSQEDSSAGIYDDESTNYGSFDPTAYFDYVPPPSMDGILCTNEESEIEFDLPRQSDPYPSCGQYAEGNHGYDNNTSNLSEMSFFETGCNNVQTNDNLLEQMTETNSTFHNDFIDQASSIEMDKFHHERFDYDEGGEYTYEETVTQTTAELCSVTFQYEHDLHTVNENYM